MGFFYFDIETTGFDPKKDSIISMQIQPLFDDGKPKGNLEIYKTFGSGEEPLYTEDALVSMMWDKLMCANIWDFVPVGFNLKFDFKFLGSRFEKKYPTFKWTDLFDRPYLDLHPLAILINKGTFKHSGLDHIWDKRCSGIKVPEWYANGEFDKIEEYVKQEADSFIRFHQKCFNLLANFGVKE